MWREGLALTLSMKTKWGPNNATSQLDPSNVILIPLTVRDSKIRESSSCANTAISECPPT